VGVSSAGPFFASISLYLLPVFGVLFSFLILGEYITVPQVPGITILLLGVLNKQRGVQKKQTENID
jgi:drug/metabolite transporter (DMT)-like permease